MQPPTKRIAFVVNNVAFFVSHRLPLAQAALEHGWDVTLLTGQAGSPAMEVDAEARLSGAKIKHIRTAFRAVGLNPFVECAGLLQLLWAMYRLRPAIVHTASPKGGLYGGLAARLLRAPALVMAVSGMGFMYTGAAGGGKRILRAIYEVIVRWILRHPNKIVIVQNSDDQTWLLASGVVLKGETVLIPGSGVSLGDYAQESPSAAEDVVVLPARMLRDKGVVEFVEAARLLKARACTWRFALVGAADYANPSAISPERIKTWVAQGAVEWWGYRPDMPRVYAQAGIICLPSYREGMPKCLLEASAAGRPVITTDVTGCRDAIIPGETGDLVPARDPQALANVVETLINDPNRRARYGLAGRNLAVRRYGIESVVEKTMTIYERLLANASA